MFGEIKFQYTTPTYAEGIYDGRKFILNYSEDESTVDGNFNDEERLFIFTQWEIKQ